MSALSVLFALSASGRRRRGAARSPTGSTGRTGPSRSTGPARPGRPLRAAPAGLAEARAHLQLDDVDTALLGRDEETDLAQPARVH